MKKTLFTIGYEHATTNAMLDALKSAKIDLVIDVRAVTSSRRPGFSKRDLLRRDAGRVRSSAGQVGSHGVRNLRLSSRSKAQAE